MTRLRRAISTYPLLAATIIVGITVLILWLMNRGVAAQILATVYVSGVVIWTTIGMVKDLLKGNFGLDILAVMAMIATLAGYRPKRVA